MSEESRKKKTEPSEEESDDEEGGYMDAPQAASLRGDDDEVLRKILEERARCLRVGPSNSTEGGVASEGKQEVRDMSGGHLPPTNCQELSGEMKMVDSNEDLYPDAAKSLVKAVTGEEPDTLSENLPRASEKADASNGESNIRPEDSHRPGAFAVLPGTDTADDASADESVESSSQELVGYPPSEGLETLSPNDPIPLEAVLVVEEGPSSDSNQDGRDIEAPSEQDGPGSSTTSARRHHQQHPVEVVEARSEPKTWTLSNQVLKELIVVLVVIVIVMMLALAGSNGKEHDDTGNDDPLIASSYTLQKIQRQGILRCYLSLPFDATQTGLDNAMCQAVAAALSVEVEWVNSTRQTMFLDLQGGRLDLLSAAVKHTMEREVFEAEQSQAGFAFSVPYLYGGMRVAGDPFYVECAERNFTHIGECKDLKLCVFAGSTHEDIAREYLPERSVVTYDDLEGGLASGALGRECNVFAMEGFCLIEKYVREHAANQNYTIGTRRYAKSPISIATRSDDPVFSDIVNSVVQALFAAQASNITKDRADEFPLTNVFGPHNRDLFRKVIHAVGNFAELHEIYLKDFPQQGLNSPNDGTTGLLYSLPFGSCEDERTGYGAPGRKMTEILEHGELRCGVRGGRNGFAMEQDDDLVPYVGMEPDYCRAVAASLFGGDETAVKYIKIPSPGQGYIMLANDEVDVVAGATWDLQTDISEPTTNMGYSFSTPYFYGYSKEQDNLCLATRQDDHQWSSYVSWIVDATIYAEERGITRELSNQMPQVLLYGPTLKRMFRNAILVVGSYADMYERNLEAFIPRGSRNVLNSHPFPTGQQYLQPGFFE